VAEPSPELIRLAQRGDRDAFAQVALSQRQYIQSIAMSIFHNNEDAEDLTQNVFIRLFRTIHQYNGESRFTTWLYRLTVNLARDELRARGRKVPTITHGGGEDDDFDPVTLIEDSNTERDPQAALVQRETRDMLDHALQKLEPQYRLALTLFYFEDLKYTEIAEIMSIPLNTVKSHIRRGRERLGAIIEHDSPDDAKQFKE